MDWLRTIDRARTALVTGGLKAIEHVLGSAPLLGTRIASPLAPDPVILVGGWSNHNGSWAAWARSMARDGIPAFAVTAPGNAMDDLDAAAQFIAREIERIRAETGAKRVDLVGFSAGGLIVRQVAKRYAVRDSIDAVVTLASPNQGLGYRLPWQGAVDPLLRATMGEAARQMVQGSSFLRALNNPAVPDAAGQVRYGSVYSAIIDGAVTASRARIPGATNIPIGKERNLLGMPIGPDHYSALYLSGGAYDAVRGILIGRG